MSTHSSLLLLVVSVAACSSEASEPGRARLREEAAVTNHGNDREVVDATNELAGSTVERGARGDAARGKALVARYECNRCHAGTEEPLPSFDHQCVRCHQAIVAESLPFPKEKLKAWHEATRHYITVPSLSHVGDTLRASWMERFLQEPVKIRTHQEEWMPRLDISANDARDIATYLTRGGRAPEERGAEAVGNVERGAKVVAEKGCLVCHELTGATRADAPLSMPPVPSDVLARAITQAPDLRLARERFRPDQLVRWIKDPSSVRPEALMPKLGLSQREAEDAAAYVLRAPLAPPASLPPIALLPLLDRHVGFEEVETRVFKKSCIHCHSEPSSAGDPGPGSVGGFGFAPRGVVLSTYPGTQRGYVGEDKQRHTLFAKEPMGGARLVEALIARHEETSGRPVPGVRGMPMGLPGLSLEDIQLVETWVHEGAPER
jgi:cytochrome c2